MTALTGSQRDALAFAWHDVTCPEGIDCRSRDLHSTIDKLQLVVQAVEKSGVLTTAKASGLREAADDIVTDWAPAWGGPGMWFTTGNAVAELVADTLRAMAAEIEP